MTMISTSSPVPMQVNSYWDEDEDEADEIKYLILEGTDEEVVAFIEGVEDPNAIVDEDCQYTLLHLAALRGSSAAVDALLEKGAEVNVQTLAGTPLHQACQNNDEDNFPSLEVIESLLQAGADPNFDNEGDIPFFEYVTNQGDVTVEGLQLLLNYGADFNLISHGETVLHDLGSQIFYSQVNHVFHVIPDLTPERVTLIHEFIEFLLANGADPTIEDAHGYTLWHYVPEEDYLT